MTSASGDDNALLDNPPQPASPEPDSPGASATTVRVSDGLDPDAVVGPAGAIGVMPTPFTQHAQHGPDAHSAKEHVEWFRDPANHHIRLDAKGRWWYGNSPVEHDAVQELFHRGLRIDEEGRVRLYVGRQWCYINPDDTAFFVRHITIHTEEHPENVRAKRLAGETIRATHVDVQLNDGTHEELDPTTLEFADNNVLYCRVKAKAEGYRARFDRSCQQQLLDYLLEEHPDGFAIRLSGQLHLL